MTYPNSQGLTGWAARIAAVLVLAAPLSALGQEPQPPAPGSAEPAATEPAATEPAAAEPAAASPGVGWATQSEPGALVAPRPGDAAPPKVLTREQIERLGDINQYLTSLVNVQGRFIQTDYRNKETRGRFYVKRPGRIRFDYRSPSRLRIVSDGTYLSIEDHDLKTVDKFPLDATPIRLLLGEDVNLARDAVILDMRQDETAVAVVLKDKSGSTSGYLQLYFKLPELELYEWVITDAQGLDTRIQLADLIAGDEKSDDFFQSSAIELDNIGNN
ncbi:MAG TPA: outer membrane lipoprotein carrier protein LolA [Rhizobiales bacterium]|nr:outer membrane lipoprotein carrier protein LolA [Hyphomicrobiales bacterium]